MSTPIAETLPSALPPAFTEGEIRQIRLDQLYESPWNPRQYYPAAAMAELVASMKEGGFRPWLPLMVRPLHESVWRMPGAGGDCYEIGAGHRRSRAAGLAGLVTVPCIVREMTDEQFLDVLNFDNSGREDVHPLHEAAGWQQWMEKTGKGVSDIAARIGQSKEYVYQRLKYSALADPVRKAFIDGHITAGHAILIARQQPAEQIKSLEYCVSTSGGSIHRPSVRDLQGHIQFNLNLDLEEAPFDLADASLVPAAGACIACPKQTKNSPPPQIPELASPARANAGAEDDEDFMSEEDLDDEEFPKGQCMDPGCFKSKVDARLVQIKATLGAAILEVSGNRKTGKKGPLGTDRYEVVTEDAKSAKPALLVDGPDVGKVVHVRVKPEGAAPARPSWEVEHEKQERERKDKDEKAKREASIRLRVLEAVRAKISTGLSRVDIQPLVQMVAACLHGGAQHAIRELHGMKSGMALEAAVPKMGELEFTRLVMELPIAEALDPWAIAWQRASADGLLALAKRYKVDAVKIRADIEEKQKAAEGGSRREVEKPAESKPKTPAKKKAAAKAASKKKSAPKKKPAKR